MPNRRGCRTRKTKRCADEAAPAPSKAEGRRQGDRKDTDYDFYTLLPGKEVPMTRRRARRQRAGRGPAPGRARQADARAHAGNARHLAGSAADRRAAAARRVRHGARAHSAGSVDDATRRDGDRYARQHAAPRQPAPAAGRRRHPLPAAGRRVPGLRPGRRDEGAASPCSASARASSRPASAARPSIACAWGPTAPPAIWPTPSASSPAAGWPAMAIKVK